MSNNGIPVCAPMTNEEARTHKAESHWFGKEYADRCLRNRRVASLPKADFQEAAKAQRQVGYDVEY